MIYEFQCKTCDVTIDLWRTLNERNAPAHCDTCGKRLTRNIVSRVQARVARSAFTVDFGDGRGEHTYNRYEYIEQCKQVGRQPVGLLFNKNEIHVEDKPIQVGQTGNSKLDYWD